ncbi:MAG TPA: response regulator [Stellaceae bacterium]|nr:response regulator [Stellaceae bacterium]
MTPPSRPPTTAAPGGAGLVHDLANLLLAARLNLETLAAEWPDAAPLPAPLDAARAALDEACRLLDRLPQGPGTAPSSGPNAPRPAPQPAHDGAGRSILLVEDLLGLRRAAARMLERLGYRVAAVAGAAEALAVLDRGGAVDLLFTDMHLAGAMDGAALVAAARQRRPGLAVVCTSGDGGALADGLPGAALLAKPYSTAELAEALDTAFAPGAAAG